MEMTVMTHGVMIALRPVSLSSVISLNRYCFEYNEGYTFIYYPTPIDVHRIYSYFGAYAYICACIRNKCILCLADYRMHRNRAKEKYMNDFVDDGTICGHACPRNRYLCTQRPSHTTKHVGMLGHRAFGCTWTEREENRWF